MKLLLTILSLLLVYHCSGQIRPNRIKLTLNPFQICLKNVTGVTLFGYHASVNSIIEENEEGQIHGEINEPVDGAWCLTNVIKIAPGDTVNYYTYALKNGKRIYSTVLTKKRPKNTKNPRPQYQIDVRYDGEEEEMIKL
ncbi:uncharacterized protein LOC143910183 [Arctopsyche grandis]|uniref:uncharacterized protein LOC143910183 n=1 Tax=Arctopsyche grandis TaxID=121162 RepID=UPI00406DA15D